MIDEQEIFYQRINRWLDKDVCDVESLKDQLLGQADFRTPSLTATIVGYMQNVGDNELADLLQSELLACLKFYSETERPEKYWKLDYYAWLEAIQHSVCDYRDPDCEDDGFEPPFHWLINHRQGWLKWIANQLGIDPNDFCISQSLAISADRVVVNYGGKAQDSANTPPREFRLQLSKTDAARKYYRHLELSDKQKLRLFQQEIDDKLVFCEPVSDRLCIFDARQLKPVTDTRDK